MPKVISTQIRIDNSNNITYVLKKFKNGTFKLSSYQKNMSSGCYSGTSKRGICKG
jgi:hypothetical protein